MTKTYFWKQKKKSKFDEFDEDDWAHWVLPILTSFLFVLMVLFMFNLSEEEKECNPNLLTGELINYTINGNNVSLYFSISHKGSEVEVTRVKTIPFDKQLITDGWHNLEGIILENSSEQDILNINIAMNNLNFVPESYFVLSIKDITTDCEEEWVFVLH